MREEFYFLHYPLCVCGRGIDCVALVVMGGWSQILPFHDMLCNCTLFGGYLKDEHLCYRGFQGIVVKTKGTI